MFIPLFLTSLISFALGMVAGAWGLLVMLNLKEADGS